MKKNNTRIKTKRLELTPLTDDELRERLDTEPDAEMRKALGDMLRGCESAPDSRLWYTEWRACLREGGDRIGSLCFKGPPNELGEAEIGYGTEEAYRGNGYAYEAARALIDWAFSQAEGLYYVTAETDPMNDASQAVLKKLGFKETGEAGEEGPRFELERPATFWLAIYMCLGMSVGLCFGVSSDNMSIGLCIGLAVGLAIGSALDAGERKKRDEMKRAREAMKQHDDA